MSAVMRHRGPDGNGQVWFDEHHSGFAHNRLSIIDLTECGAQPMSGGNGRHWITFNGEIYNYRELRRELEELGHRFVSSGDTEVLLHALMQWDTDAIDKLDGMFAFVWMDRASGRVVGARDHLGIKPLYYAHVGNGLLFASEIKALLQTSLLRGERDEAVLRTPSRFVPAPDTGFAGVRKLPPAHWFELQHGSLRIQRYWTIAPSESMRDEAAAIEHVGSLVEQSVTRQMVSDVPVGTFLSGGLDSSLISALMRKHYDGAIDAFTITFSSEDKKSEKDSDDLHYARKVADKFGFRLHEFEIAPNITDLLPLMVWHMDEPLSDPAAINTYLMSRAARDMGIIVLLNGVGGDEVFGGYRKHLACLRARQYQQVVPSTVRAMIHGVVQSLPVATRRGSNVRIRMGKRFLGFAELPEAERFLASDMSLNAAQYRALYDRDYYTSPFWQHQHEVLEDRSLPYLTRMCLNDSTNFLPEHNLLYSDKAAMAASIETRPPLIGKDIVTAMFKASPDLRIRGSVQKYLLKKIGERYLPHDVVHRPKASFGSPLRAWVRGPLRGLVDDLLSETTIRHRGLYNYREVRALIDDDREGRADNSLWIWTMLTVEVWHRTFMDRETPDGPITL